MDSLTLNKNLLQLVQNLEDPFVVFGRYLPFQNTPFIFMSVKLIFNMCIIKSWPMVGSHLSGNFLDLEP